MVELTLGEAVAKIKARLRELGPNTYWLNGVIRERKLHPTKGWRSSRIETMRFAPMAGYIDHETRQFRQLSKVFANCG